MRVKSLVAGVGLSVVAALALGPAVASANRGSVSPNIEESTEVDPAVPAEETPAPVEETTTTTTAPEVVEVPVPPVVEEQAPGPVKKPAAPTTTTTQPAPVETPVVVPVPVVPVQPQEAPAPAADKGKDKDKDKDKGAKDPCHMDSYKPVLVTSLSGDERTRAEKVDRNGNGTVCRKEIPGKGKGNTHQHSNIKDDQDR